jgi:hypothetical protein
MRAVALLCLIPACAQDPDERRDDASTDNTGWRNDAAPRLYDEVCPPESAHQQTCTYAWPEADRHPVLDFLDDRGCLRKLCSHNEECPAGWVCLRAEEAPCTAPVDACGDSHEGGMECRCGFGGAGCNWQCASREELRAHGVEWNDAGIPFLPDDPAR